MDEASSARSRRWRPDTKSAGVRLFVDPDIRSASAIDARFYRDPALYALAAERIFAKTWQWIGDIDDVVAAGSLSPRTLLPGLLDEPLLLSRDASGELHCLSNVCTHRGNLLVERACRATEMRCRYHSRRFDLRGRMTFMPGFDDALDFPSPTDDLPRIPFASWAGLAFASLSPATPFEDVMRDVTPRIEGIAPIASSSAPARARDYEIAAHWALYVDNYLEGFHIPFVHPELARVIDLGAYESELLAHGTLQIALAGDGEAAFDRPPATRDHGRRIAAYYVWLFPNLMLNFYPWGLSVNLVLPVGIERTRVLFRSYVSDPSKLDQGAGGALDVVEEQDEAIVEAVQRGVRSRLYRSGRYSPAHERGVHHFHRMISSYLERD